MAPASVYVYSSRTIQTYHHRLHKLTGQTLNLAVLEGTLNK